MKLSLRRPDADPTASADGPPPPPRPPRGRPVVAYAAVLDGRHLWLAVHAAPGSLALRGTGPESGTGDVVALRSDVGDDDPAYRSVRVDLEELSGPDDATYDAVLVPPGGGAARAVWTHPLPSPQDTGVRTPRAHETHGWSLARLDDGTLQVRRTPVPPTAVLHDIRLEGDAVTIALLAPAVGDDAAEPVLRLVDADGVLVLTRPLTARDGLLHASLSLADLPPGEETWPRLHVGDLPVRRRRNDLVDAEKATILPLIMGADETPAARFRFTPDGTLAVRLTPRPGAAAG